MANNQEKAGRYQEQKPKVPAKNALHGYLGGHDFGKGFKGAAENPVDDQPIRDGEKKMGR